MRETTLKEPAVSFSKQPLKTLGQKVERCCLEGTATFARTILNVQSYFATQRAQKTTKDCNLIEDKRGRYASYIP